MTNSVGNPFPKRWQFCYPNLTEYIYNLHNCKLYKTLNKKSHNESTAFEPLSVSLNSQLRSAKHSVTFSVLGQSFNNRDIFIDWTIYKVLNDLIFFKVLDHLTCGVLKIAFETIQTSSLENVF